MSGARKLSHFVCNLYACGRQWKGAEAEAVTGGRRVSKEGEHGAAGEQGNRGKLGTVCAEHAAPHSAALTETLANFH